MVQIPKPALYLFFLLLAATMFSSCGGTKYVGEGQLLYTGAQVEFVDSPNVKRKKKLSADLEALAKPSPNSKFSLGIYNTFHNPNKEKGLGNWISRTLGQAPVIFQIQDAEQSYLIMEDYLKDHGYFNSKVTFDTIVKAKEVSVTYNVKSPGQYSIREIFLPADSTPLTHLIHENQKKSVLKTQEAYKLTNINAERIRLAKIANDRGFYAFNENYLYFFVDTTAGTDELLADIYVEVKNPTDSTQHELYYMEDVYVYPTYNLDGDASRFISDTVRYEDLHIIKNYDFIDPPTLKRSIAQDRGELFSASRQDQTVNHLLDLGVFKFVNMRYQTLVRNDTNYLQRRIFLTPALTQDVTAEVEVNTEASNSLGSAISVTYRNRNLFQGAEAFNASLSGGIETQIGQPNMANATGSTSFVNTLELTGQANLIFPRFIVPFGLAKKVSSFYVPKTRFTISDNFQRRTSFFTINSFRFEYAYDWQETRYKRHSFSPLNINQVNLLNTSGAFDTILMQNPRLRASFNNTFIAGLSYQFTYSNQELNLIKDYTFFKGQIETSGNAARLLTSTFGQNQEPYQLFGTPFSQYVRFDTEIRHNIVKPKNSLVGRLLVGVGIPYGNSFIMPYIKQFFVGGANSVRAFQIRSVGPGSIPRDPNAETANFFDRTGDIKVEANLEYRFDIFSFLKGAVFTDAGNVWLLRDRDQDDIVPEAEFHFNRFYKELAFGAGLGLRLDFTFVLLRLDAAIPLHNPNQLGGPAWVVNQILPLNESIVYNLAIGYPF